MLCFNQSRRVASILLLVLVSCVWGGSFSMMRIVLHGGLSVGEVLSLRFTLGALLLWLATGRKQNWDKRTVTLGITLGLVMTVLLWLQTDGLRFTSTAKSGFLTSLYVVLTPFVALLFGRTLDRLQWVGAIIAGVGMYKLFAVADQGWGQINRGDLETIFCAFFAALHIVLTGRFSRRDDVMALTNIQVSVIGLSSLIVSLLLPGMLEPTRVLAALGSYEIFMPILYMTLLSTAFCFLAQTYVQTQLSSVETATVLSLQPLVAVFISRWFLHEHLSHSQLVGGLLVVAAMLFVELIPDTRRPATSVIQA
jgi:drug/metabolite transporter (DMT)-like permease